MSDIIFVNAWLTQATGGVITFVNSASASSTSGALTITLPGGMAQNDLVLVGYFCQAASFPAPTTSGYTFVADDDNTGATYYYKFMGASPDASVSWPSIAGSGNYGQSAVAFVFRGVNTSSPINGTPNEVVGVDPGAITPSVNNCCIVVGTANASVDNAPGTITNYLGALAAAADGSTNDASIAMTYRILSGGSGVSENPGAWSAFPEVDFSGSVTIALAPA